ncbi:hypothetical protein DRO55_04990 [Candidatus Bathyarchaeota archaeon]|nr:MAG: hypothetical protein DRO55_04990 [Candidatus Bathyarchaeota archaeon]
MRRSEELNRLVGAKDDVRGMRIGLSMLYCLGRPFPQLLTELERVEAGCVELVDEGGHSLNERRVRALRRVIEDGGLEVTVHAPFVDVNIASPVPTIRRAVLKRLKRSMLYAHELGSKVWVFHPGLHSSIAYFHPGLDWKLNIQSTRELLEAAEQLDTKIAIENIFDPSPFLLKSVEDFIRFYEELGSDAPGLAFDIGHAYINRQVAGFIERLSDRIIHIHAHDNDGTSDSHKGIGYGGIDWDWVINALKEAGYEGFIIVESIEGVEESVERLKRLL